MPLALVGAGAACVVLWVKPVLNRLRRVGAVDRGPSLLPQRRGLGWEGVTRRQPRGGEDGQRAVRPLLSVSAILEPEGPRKPTPYVGAAGAALICRLVLQRDANESWLENGGVKYQSDPRLRSI